jgi:hypothetical protein
MSQPVIMCGMLGSIAVWMNSHRLYTTSSQHFRLLNMMLFLRNVLHALFSLMGDRLREGPRDGVLSKKRRK